ncbi:MAG: hypothetical protein WCC74_02970 [Minisyncoccia bacterium]
MNENFQKNPQFEKLNPETDSGGERQKEDFLIHSLEYRNPLQILVFKMLGVENDVEQIMKYSKMIRNFIDDPKNHEVRSLILQKKIEEAAKIVIAEIHKEEGHMTLAA